MAKTVEVGMYYTSYGKTTATIPDDIEPKDIPNYLRDHIDEIPLPKNAEYVDDSADIDTENIKIIG